MNKTIVFDLDGTVVDLYGVDNWLECLRSEDESPYVVASPLVDMDILNTLLNELKALGWRVAVTTWLAKGSTKRYDELVRKAKVDWLERYGFPYDEIHLVKYGTTKANCTRKLGGYQVLVDDNAQVRKGWHLGDTIDANGDIINGIMELLLTE